MKNKRKGQKTEEERYERKYDEKRKEQQMDKEEGGVSRREAERHADMER